MDKILPAYHDPLFSIFIIVVMVLVVAVTSAIVGSYKEDKKRKQLKNFLGSLSKDECVINITKVPFEAALITPLTMLSNTLTSQGEYQKAISIYLYLIEHIQDFRDKEHLLEALGKTYLRGGFLKRSESIFLEILRKRPRNQTALYSIEIVYELLNDHVQAMQTLKPLEILGAKPEKIRAHLELEALVKSVSLTPKEKIEKLCIYLKDSRYSYRRTVQELFKLDPKAAWQVVDGNKVAEIIDILWFLPTSNLNFDIIRANSVLSALYSARGILAVNEAEEESGIFSVDTLIAARRGGNEEVDLRFSYGCGSCKQHFPISFVRCPNCYAIDAIYVKESIAKKQSQTGYSLL